MGNMVSLDNDSAPFLNVSDPNFSIRSADVLAARDASWYARTPYGIAVLRYSEMSRLLPSRKLRQGSYAWPAHNNATGTFADWWMRMLLSLEGPDHARLRKLASPAFAPELIALLKPKFQALANELIDAFEASGRCEFMSDFAEPYAARVVLTLLDLPHDNWRQFADLAVEMGLALSVNYHQEMERINAATDRMFSFAKEVIARRRQAPLGADFLSSLIRAQDAGDQSLSEQEVYDMVVLTIFGGIDTTRNQLGLAMDTFIHHPEQWDLLKERPELAPAAVEEIMRYRPTVTWVTREAVEDFEFEGLQIPKGCTVHLFSQSAGSDPRIYDEPGFNITAERPRRHFGFGGGVHHCIGHFIARGDMTEALAILADRVRKPRFDGDPSYLPDSGNTGPMQLPVAFDRRD
jgi:cytochrome P450